MGIFVVLMLFGVYKFISQMQGLQTRKQNTGKVILRVQSWLQIHTRTTTSAATNSIGYIDVSIIIYLFLVDQVNFVKYLILLVTLDMIY